MHYLHYIQTSGIDGSNSDNYYRDTSNLVISLGAPYYLIGSKSIGKQTMAGVKQVLSTVSTAAKGIPRAVFNKNVGAAALKTGATVFGVCAGLHQWRLELRG